MAGAVVIAAILAAFILSGKIGMYWLKRASQWELDDEKILRRRHDGHTAEIPLTGIKSLCETRGWLLVWGWGTNSANCHSIRGK